MKKKKLLTNRLASIYGIGKNLILNIFKKIGLNKKKQLTHVKKDQNELISGVTKTFITKMDLKEEMFKFIDFPNKIRTYKAMRNRLHYPSRGQRTHTNAKTKKRGKKLHKNAKIKKTGSKLIRN